VVNTVVPEKDKADAVKFLSIFPPQKTAMLGYQVIRDGNLYQEFRIHDEQFQYIFTLVKGLQALGGDKKTPAPPAK
jgi:hypothetical protein